MKLLIKFTSEKSKQVYQNGSLLQYATQGASGFDLRAIAVSSHGNEFNLDKEFTLAAGDRCLVKGGISSSMPSGFEMQVRPRSGLALKNGITVLNTPGTVDSDYRGEIGVILLNTSREPFVIKQGDRIAQAVISKIEIASFEFVEDLNDTARSSGGFGSTGVI